MKARVTSCGTAFKARFMKFHVSSEVIKDKDNVTGLVITCEFV